jgi:hypothetical protein
MFYKIISFALLVFLVGAPNLQAQNAYLDLTSDTQSDSAGSSVQQGRVMLDSDSSEVGGDGEDLGAPTQEQSGYVDPKTGLIIENIGDTSDPDRPITTGDVPEPKPTGIEHEDIGVTDNDNNDDGTSDADSSAWIRVKQPWVGKDTPAGSQGAPSQTRVILLAPSAEDHDPGITIMENLAARGIDDDEFGFVSGGQVYVRSGYLKMDGIKGESSDSSSGGNAETTWKVEEGEAAKKPKEIVVVGSKSIDKASPKILEATCQGLNATCQPQDAVTPETLADFAERTVNSFDSVNEIRMDDAKVEVDSAQDFRLFGFIPMRLKQTVSVSVEPDDFGRVKVKFPWYHVLGRKTVRPHDLQTGLETGVSAAQFSKWEAAELDAANDETQEKMVDSFTFNFHEVRAQLLQAVSHALAQYNESDLNFLK